MPFVEDVLSCMVEYDLIDIAAKAFKASIPSSNNIFSHRVKDIADQFERKLVDEIKESPTGFKIQLDESIDVANHAKFIVFTFLKWFCSSP